MDNNVLLNKSLVYHSVNFDIFKLISILSNGIYSFNKAKEKGFNINRNSVGYNGDDYISVAEYSITYGVKNAFNIYIKNGLSVIIDSSNYNKVRDQGPSRGPLVPFCSGIYGHVYIKDYINPNDIIGIMVPGSCFKEKIIDLDIGLNKVQLSLLSNYVLNYVRNIIIFFDYPVDLEKVNDMLDELNNLMSNKTFNDKEKVIKINELIKRINNFLVSNLSLAISKKFDIQEPTLELLIEKYNINDLPIYDIEGNLIKRNKTY